jgi:hypothetical protein
MTNTGALLRAVFTVRDWESFIVDSGRRLFGRGREFHGETKRAQSKSTTAIDY